MVTLPLMACVQNVIKTPLNESRHRRLAVGQARLQLQIVSIGGASSYNLKTGFEFLESWGIFSALGRRNLAMTP
jgi:hypothetical protein